MRKKKTAFLACTLICILVLGAGAAQGGAENPDRHHRFDQARELLEKLKAERMQKALALDEKTAGQVAEISKRYDQQRFELRKNTKDDLQALRKALSDKNDAEIRTALERAEQRHQAIHTLHMEERAELKKVLTPEQMAKYLLFQAAFMKEMREKIREIKHRRGESSLR